MGLQLRGALCLGRSVRLSVTRLEPLFFEDFEANTMDLLAEIKFLCRAGCGWFSGLTLETD
jgi:hypothetical protein